MIKIYSEYLKSKKKTKNKHKLKYATVALKILCKKLQYLKNCHVVISKNNNLLLNKVCLVMSLSFTPKRIVFEIQHTLSIYY